MKFPPKYQFRFGELYTVFFLWLILSAINIDKAYHIDDTFYLEAAEYVKENPLKPMSATILWFDSPTPLYKGNQPPLFYYLIALISKLFGNLEIFMHLFLSIFTLSSLYWFKRITDLLKAGNKNLLLILFAFCPAFIVNQNLMADVPILAIILGVLYYVLKAKKAKGFRDYIFAAIILSFGLLMKYSVLPLLATIVLIIIISKDYKKLVIILIPLFVLALWSLWNKFEFGFIHLLDRPKNNFRFESIYEFISCLGALSTFTISFVYVSIPRKFTKWLIFVFLLAFTVYACLFYFDIIHFKLSARYLDRSFFVLGMVLIALLIKYVFEGFLKEKQNYIQTYEFIILLFVSSLSLFIILFAPFIATRHMLMVIPLILLFGHKLFEKAGKFINSLTLVSAILLGLLLGVSDWIYADFYRKMANEVKINTTKNVWTIGHWGWQWYSKQNGMKVYSLLNEKDVREGDYFVYPVGISKQGIGADIDLRIIVQKSLEPGFFTFFSVNKYASMYKSEINKPPWRLSKDPIDTIVIAIVEGDFTKDEMDEQIAIIIKTIKSNKHWLNIVKEKAEKKNISIDSMLLLDAQWMIDQNRKK